jgi:hypothetical protein
MCETDIQLGMGHKAVLRGSWEVENGELLQEKRKAN